MKKLIFIVIIIFPIFIYSFNSEIAYADKLNESINEQINKIDFNELENFYKNNFQDANLSFIDRVKLVLTGNYNFEEIDIGQYIGDLLVLNIKKLFPLIIGVIIIALITSLLNGLKGKFLSESISEIIYFASVLCVILIFSKNIVSAWNETKITIENLVNLNSIMSPIILTLMVVCGSNVSVSIYKPSVAIFTNISINVFNLIILPLILVTTIFSILNTFTSNIKLGKFVLFFNSCIKWLIGILVAIFSIFISIQGLSASIHDGISIKAAKFAISNSIPIVGGFLKDGFDLVVAGSVLIKNSIGVVCIILIIFKVLSPIIFLLIFSILLKLTSAITENFGESKISELCFSLSNAIQMFNVCIIMVTFMFFINILFLIISGNAFI